MKKKLFILHMIIFLSLFFQQEECYAQSNLEQIHDYLEALEENDKFMGAIAIRAGNDLLYQQAEGWAFIKDSIPLTQETKFRIGSVTKIFTAVMIFQLIQQDAIQLNTTLDEFFPEIANAEKITIDMMLAHRSGIHNFTDDPDYLSYMSVYNSREQMLKRMAEKGSDFSPDSTSQYSNANYVLLGYILEDLTGKTYADLLKHNITRPLGLSQTYYEDSTQIEQDECYSYRHSGKSWFKVPETDMSIPHGAGGIVSTPAELTKFIRALFNLELISQSSLNKMTELQDGMGRGLFRYVIEEVDTAFGHGGAIDAFITTLQYFPEQDVAIAVCTNGSNYRFSQVLQGITDIYFDNPFEIPQFDQLNVLNDSSNLIKYTGVFSTENFPLDIELKIKEGQLYGQATGQMAIPLTWESKQVLVYPAANIALNFSEAEIKEGKVQSFKFTQGFEKYTFNRKTNP